MRNEKMMIRLLWSLRIFLVLNVGLFFYLMVNSEYWYVYALANAVLVLGYVWFAHIRLFWYELKGTKYIEPLKDASYSVVIPCYNEDPDLIKATIQSVVNQTDSYKRELIIVDDGSTNGAYSVLKGLKQSYPDEDIHLYRFNTNKGKRIAHELAFRKSRYEYIISIDSDTVLKEDAIKNLLRPFANEKIGATTGNILLKNERKNILTRIQAGLYWIGLNIYKKGQSMHGDVMCCSGCLSAYRKEDLMDILDEYVNQKFLGNACHASEDRFLTNLLNEKGKDVLYVEDSICWTEAPTTLSKFIRQQLRWKRGFYREALYTMTYSWKKSKIVFFENLVCSLFTPYLNFSMRMVALYSMVFKPLFFVTVLLPSWILFIVCRDSLLFVREPAKGFWYLPYIFIYNTILYPLNIYAIFLTEPEKWGTR